MSKWICSVCLFAPLCAFLMPAIAEPPASAEQPNVLFVFSDMQRAYSMGCYGDANARTPHLDGLAKEGARFDAAISNTPVCCPYRACLLSGQYAHHNGVISNGVFFQPTVKCVAETFRDAGYQTGYSGKWHISTPPDLGGELRYGFPEAGTPFGFYRTDRNSANVTDVALEFIAEKSRGEKPWLLFVSWILPHSPYKCRKDIASISATSRFRPMFRPAPLRTTRSNACRITMA